MFPVNGYSLTVRFMVYNSIDRRWVTNTETPMEADDGVNEHTRFLVVMPNPKVYVFRL